MRVDVTLRVEHVPLNLPLGDAPCRCASWTYRPQNRRRAASKSLPLFYSREGRESQDAALLMSVVGQFVASSWAAHGCRGVLQVLSRGGFPFPEGYTAA